MADICVTVVASVNALVCARWARTIASRSCIVKNLWVRKSGNTASAYSWLVTALLTYCRAGDASLSVFILVGLAWTDRYTSAR